MLNFICFEQAFNELIRVCLKLEHLFQEVQLGIKIPDEVASRVAIEALVNINNLLDRPDLKSKLVKELHRIILTISRLADSDKVDHGTLKQIIAELELLTEQVHDINGKIAQDLRDNEFLNSIRQQANAPGGVCGFEVPAYLLWLQQPAKQRVSDLQEWAKQLAVMQRTVNLLLDLIRQSTIPQSKIATGGFYQMGLDAQASLQLLQIYLPQQTQFFPEVSVGRHGVSVRFYGLDAQQKRRSQITQDISFKISICIL